MSMSPNQQAAKYTTSGGAYYTMRRDNMIRNGVCLSCEGSRRNFLFFKCGECYGYGWLAHCQACGGSGRGWIFSYRYCHGSGRV